MQQVHHEAHRSATVNDRADEPASDLLTFRLGAESYVRKSDQWLLELRSSAPVHALISNLTLETGEKK